MASPKGLPAARLPTEEPAHRLKLSELRRSQPAAPLGSHIRTNNSPSRRVRMPPPGMIIIAPEPARARPRPQGSWACCHISSRAKWSHEMLTLSTDDPLDDLPEALPEERKPTRLVAVDDNGNRVGEDHPRAKLTNAEVDLIRQLWEERDEHPISIRQIAEKFEVGKSIIHGIVTFQRRATYPTGFRRVAVTPGAAAIFGKHVRVR